MALISTGTGADKLAAGTTLQRPAAVLADAGLIRFNSETLQLEQWDGYNWGSIGGGVEVSPTPPTPAAQGDLWYDPNDGRLYVYYTDANSSQWVDASPDNATEGGGGASVEVGDNPPGGATEGDLWYNTGSTGGGRLYVFYQDVDSSQWVDTNPSLETGGGGGGASVTVGENPPANPQNGDLWWDTSSVDGGRMYLYYDDGNSSQWVETNPGGSGGGSEGASVVVSDQAPTSASEGDLWWDSSDGGGQLYVWYSDADSSQWVNASGGAASPGDGFWQRNGTTLSPDNVADGVNISGQTSGTEKSISGYWDLSAGNNWTVGAIAIPDTTNGVTGQSGTLTMTAAPTSWPVGGTLKYPGGNAPAPSSFPAVVPFYVKSPTEVLLGNATEGIS